MVDGGFLAAFHGDSCYLSQPVSVAITARKFCTDCCRTFYDYRNNRRIFISSVHAHNIHHVHFCLKYLDKDFLHLVLCLSYTLL